MPGHFRRWCTHYEMMIIVKMHCITMTTFLCDAPFHYWCRWMTFFTLMPTLLFEDIIISLMFHFFLLARLRHWWNIVFRFRESFLRSQLRRLFRHAEIERCRRWCFSVIFLMYYGWCSHFRLCSDFSAMPTLRCRNTDADYLKYRLRDCRASTFVFLRDYCAISWHFVKYFDYGNISIFIDIFVSGTLLHFHYLPCIADWWYVTLIEILRCQHAAPHEREALKLQPLSASWCQRYWYSWCWR